MVAPSEMSACASASWVASLPWALSTLNCDEENPAIWKALVMYGASKVTHRVELVVSGRMTPTRPLPDEARPFSWPMAEKLFSKDFVLSEGTLAVPDDEL